MREHFLFSFFAHFYTTFFSNNSSDECLNIHLCISIFGTCMLYFTGQFFKECLWKKYMKKQLMQEKKLQKTI